MVKDYRVFQESADGDVHEALVYLMRATPEQLGKALASLHDPWPYEVGVYEAETGTMDYRRVDVSGNRP